MKGFASKAVKTLFQKGSILISTTHIIHTYIHTYILHIVMYYLHASLWVGLLLSYWLIVSLLSHSLYQIHAITCYYMLYPSSSSKKILCYVDGMNHLQVALYILSPICLQLVYRLIMNYFLIYWGYHGPANKWYSFPMLLHVCS